MITYFLIKTLNYPGSTTISYFPLWIGVSLRIASLPPFIGISSTLHSEMGVNSQNI